MSDPNETNLPDSPGVRAWDLMSQIWRSCKPYIEEVASSVSMTPQQLLALKVMGEHGTMAMSELAIHLGCDASNVTSIVDKLEKRGIVERRSAEHDRRVKSLVVTPEGQQLFEVVKTRFLQPPPAIGGLATEDQEELCAIFTRALASMYELAARRFAASPLATTRPGPTLPAREDLRVVRGIDVPAAEDHADPRTPGVHSAG